LEAKPVIAPEVVVVVNFGYPVTEVALLVLKIST
jgi:hypothetical protein